jgi:inhibitor of KinA sporulation pathway (predicted exonuclease)
MTVPVELTSKAMSDLAQITGHVKIYNDVATTRAVIKALFAAEHNAPRYQIHRYTRVSWRRNSLRQACLRLGVGSPDWQNAMVDLASRYDGDCQRDRRTIAVGEVATEMAPPGV